MNRGLLISIGLIILGFVFEGIYLTSESLLIDAKAWLLGLICITTGTLGIWIFGGLRLLNNEEWKNEPQKKNMRGS